MRTIPVDISIRPSRSLSPRELDEIWALTERYVDTSRAHYERKLLALPEVSLWRLRTGALVGLAGLDVYPVAWRSRIRVIVFTSSVVTDERFRGRNLVLRPACACSCARSCAGRWPPPTGYSTPSATRVIS